MEIPQIIYIAITGIGLLLSARDHGKPRNNGNFWYAFIGTFVGYLLLIWGGFFN